MAAISETTALYMSEAEDQHTLPSLRDDIELLPAPRQEDGTPAWMLHDPVRHQFYRIGRVEFEILSRWRLADPEKVAAAVNRATTLSITLEHVLHVERFCRTNQLLRPQAKALIQGLTAKKRNIFSLLLSSLYQRLPLCRPDAFLEASLPLARIWFLKGFWQFIVVVGIIGGYLTLRQWEQFLQTFLYFYSLEGVVYFSGTLTLVKAGHELAHAYTAKRYGLKVPVMGVAFIIFWPILYTDTTDAWKLSSRKERLHIGIAGVSFELAIAVFATAFWHFLPMGPWKGVMFLLASSTWIMTLTVNLNPFMRFDGYYILSDLLDIPNLQPRSFVLCRWFLRRLILGMDLPCPEMISFKQKSIMLLYGYATWVYRLFLYTGIALLVYHFFFKALGIFLLAGEIVMFICLPIAREFRAWGTMRSQLKLNGNVLFSGIILAALLTFFFYPWQSEITIPALYKSRSFSRIFTPEAAIIKESQLARGQLVEQGQTLLVLDSPSIGHEKTQAELEVELLETQLKRMSFFEDYAEQIPVVEQQLVEALTALSGARQQGQRLRITSPIRGKVVDVTDSLDPGRWLKEGEPVATIVDLENMMIEGYVHEQDYSRLQEGQHGMFYPADPELPSVGVQLKNIASSHSITLEAPYLASVFGGDLPVQMDETGSLQLRQSLYRVELEPFSLLPGNRILRGTVKIEGEPVSLASRAWTAIQAIVIRESDF